MNRLSLIGIATAVLAVSAPALAQDDVDAERAFSRAARSFTACLAAAATADHAVALDSSCLVQETAYRTSGVVMRISRGFSEEAAASETEVEIANGRRTFGAAQARRFASAN